MKYKSEKEAIKHYKEMWKDAPYTPTFVTVDVAIFWEDSILLIKRGNYPGKGKWALPGGFLDNNETLKEAALRELKEETNVELENLWVDEKDGILVDTPDRDPRGRFITHVFAFHIWNKNINIKAGDDAAHAEWVKMSDIIEMSSDDFFIDHYDIIKELTIYEN